MANRKARFPTLRLTTHRPDDGPDISPLSYIRLSGLYPYFDPPSLAFASMEFGNMLLYDVGIIGMPQPIHQLHHLARKRLEPCTDLV